MPILLNYRASSGTRFVPQPQRSPEQIRDSMEANRMHLEVSVQRLRGEVERLADWRGHLERHSGEIAMGVAAVGLLLGGILVLCMRHCTAAETDRLA